MVPTLLPVRPGPHLIDVGLLRVCHCHCHCHCHTGKLDFLGDDVKNFSTSPGIWKTFVRCRAVRLRSTVMRIILGDHFRICLRIQPFLVWQWGHVPASLLGDLENFTFSTRRWDTDPARLCSTVDTCSASARRFCTCFPLFPREDRGSDPEVDSCPSLLATSNGVVCTEDALVTVFLGELGS